MKALISLVLIFFTTISFAKTSKLRTKSKKATTAKWVISPVIGTVSTQYSISNLPADEISGVESKAGTGFTGGLNVDLPTRSRYITYSTGLIYSKNTTTYTYNVDNGTFTGKASGTNELERLNLPLTATIFPFQKRNGFFVKAGIVGHYLMGGRESFSSSGQLNENNTLTPLSNNESRDLDKTVFNEYGADALISTGIKFPGRKGIGILIEAQYQHGLTNLVNYEDSPEVFKTQSLAAILGLNFSF